MSKESKRDDREELKREQRAEDKAESKRQDAAKVKGDKDEHDSTLALALSIQSLVQRPTERMGDRERWMWENEIGKKVDALVGCLRNK